MRENKLTPWLVRYGYEKGLFPMGDEDGRVAWYEPRQRALFPMSGIHVSRSLRKTIARGEFDVRFDTAFERVVRSCVRPEDNWITKEIIQVYTQIHYEGWAHCSECWFGGDLVGGVYGLAIGGCFCAESMFHTRTDASKVALLGMVERCASLNFTMFDAQIMNPHLKSLGAYEIPQREYLRQLKEALLATNSWSGCHAVQV